MSRAPGMGRRGFLITAAGARAGGIVSSAAAAVKPSAGGFRFALNPATIRGYGCSLKEQIRVCCAAGYQGLEPWLSDLQAAKTAVELGDIRKMCVENGLTIVNGIGFAPWAVNDAAARKKGLEALKRDMALIAEVGGHFIATPPSGISDAKAPTIACEDLVERYQAALALGDRMGVTPILEFWGASKNLSRLDQALSVASASGHPKACVLADVYHMYRGGSSYEGLRFLSPATLPVLHVNDFPSTPARTQLKDADRVWPGDGCAPWTRIRELLAQGHLRPWLSLELFNASYWKTTPLETARTGLAKMRRVFG